MPPQFSIILPTYNRAAMVKAALQSVLAQTFGDYECFVLDDGSTDNTPAALAEFNGEPRFRIIRFEENRRQHVRRNYALSLATGAFIAFLDSDDVWLPQRLEIFNWHIREKPSVDFWFSNAYLWRYGRVIGRVFNSSRPIPQGQMPGWYAVGERLPYLTSNLAIRKAVFDRVGNFREDMEILEDTELYARMLGQGASVGVVRVPLAIRRLHGEQITHRYDQDYQEALLALRSGEVPPEQFEVERKALALETARCFVRSLRPKEAREFLGRELGEQAKATTAYAMTFIPSIFLSVARKLRKAWLMLRYHPAWASRELRQVYRTVRPWMEGS